jgi:putative PIN family toxin of toxin-antitoxin system
VGEGEKVVIDVNVFISAFGWGGTPFKVIELLEKGKIRNCISEEILTELCNTVAYPKLDFPPPLQADIIEFALAYSDIFVIKKHIAVAPDPDDNKFIECAVAADAKYVVTGDKDFLSIRQYKSTRIVTPDAFLHKRKITF